MGLNHLDCTGDPSDEYIRQASLWMPANMLAWMAGMPIIFSGIDVTGKLSGLGWVILFMAGILHLAGLVVGAIHGAFLVRLAMAAQGERDRQ